MALSPELHVEILECLRRSGYLLESRLVHSLSAAGFFVEPNVAIIDRRTGKNREMDIVAEYFGYDPAHPKISVRSHFAIEAINNHLPLVLTTPYPFSPNSEVANLRYGTTPSPSPFESEIDLYDEKGTFNTTCYSQYCALSRKKTGDQLMASHSDDLYSSLLKVAEFIEQRASEFEDRDWAIGDEYWRLWFWEGILVVGGDLLVATEDMNGDLALAEIDRASLIFNFHLAEQPKTATLQVIREREFLPYLTGVVAADQRLTSRIFELRSSMPGATTFKSDEAAPRTAP